MTRFLVHRITMMSIRFQFVFISISLPLKDGLLTENFYKLFTLPNTCVRYFVFLVNFSYTKVQNDRFFDDFDAFFFYKISFYKHHFYVNNWNGTTIFIRISKCQSIWNVCWVELPSSLMSSKWRKKIKMIMKIIKLRRKFWAETKFHFE